MIVVSGSEIGSKDSLLLISSSTKVNKLLLVDVECVMGRVDNSNPDDATTTTNTATNKDVVTILAVRDSPPKFDIMLL